VLAGRGVKDHLGDVGRVVADPLQILGDEQQMRRLADVVRVFHHVREQGAEDRIVEIIDRLVAFAHPHRRCGVAFDERVEHVVDHAGRNSRHLRKQGDRLDLADILEQRNAPRDILGIIADPLDDAGNLERGNDVAEVTGHWRTQGNQLDCVAFGLDLERIELLVLLDDLQGAIEVAPDEAAHGLADRMFGKPAHLADQRAQPLDVLIERLQRMSAHLLHVVTPISRSGR